MLERIAAIDRGFLLSVLIVGFAILVTKHVVGSVRNLSRLPRSIYWAGQQNETLPRFRACIRQLFTGIRSLDAGYSQYNRNGKSFVMPGLGFGPIVILPQEHIPWLIAQPDSRLSARIPQGDRIALKYTMPSHDFRRDMFQIDIRKILTPNLNKFQTILFDDMRKHIDLAFGFDKSSWREVHLSEAMHDIMFSSLNRVVVGQPLCYDPGYLKSLSSLIYWLGGSGLVVGQLIPPFMKPIFGYLAAVPIHYYKTNAMSRLLPVIKERMSSIGGNNMDSSSENENTMCLLTNMAAAAVEGNDARDLTPETVATNILFLGLAGVFPTILTATNAFLDIFTSDSSQKIYQKLREEAADVFKIERDWTDHSNLGRLVLADSAIKETLRLSPLLFRGMIREVARSDGIDLPDGHHLPQGTWLGVAIDRIHHDDRFYENPNDHDPFRFVRGQGGHETSGADKLSTSPTVQGFINPSDTYLAWGYGRHACPGRWFVAQQLKLLLAYISLNYDIQSLERERPRNHTIGDSMVPPQDTTITVRRRQETSA